MLSIIILVFALIYVAGRSCIFISKGATEEGIQYHPIWPLLSPQAKIVALWLAPDQDPATRG